MTDAELQALLETLEGERCEFKEAKEQYAPEKLARYCCALANEGGGKIVFGVTDRRPRNVVGSHAFQQLESTRSKLMQQIPLNIAVLEVMTAQGRVLVFEVPSRPIGTPIKFEGKYWSREGDSLVPMSEDKLRSIFAEGGRDFSSEICPGAGMEHLSPEAIEDFRLRWQQKSGNMQLAALDHSQLLHDAELLVDGGVTYAALVLFGTCAALGRFLGQAEVIFEYKSSQASGPPADRVEYRQGFFSFHDSIWMKINDRNEKQHYQMGLFLRDIPTFDERSVREALLNAVSHRDYQLGGSVFVRQYPRMLQIDSPGGFPVGITIDNILDRQSPRNRRIAEAFAKCGLVERSGQGMNLMFEQSIRQGKHLPSLGESDAFNVVLQLDGQVNAPRFVSFLENVGAETHEAFSTYDFMLLDLIHREQEIPERLKPHIKRMLSLGIIESQGRGRSVRYFLSKRFYGSLGERATYTRKAGLDREESKALLVKHLRHCGEDGCQIAELAKVLPSKARREIQRLLFELRDEGMIFMTGEKRGARWHAGSDD